MNADYEKAEKLNLTNKNRWEEGIIHHPMSFRIMGFLEEHDFRDYSDYFCWKSGGDGDNGETLMYEMDAFFEMLDMEEKMANKKLTSEWSLKNPPYIDKKDKRYKKYTKQIKEYGFCDAETWSLDYTIAKFILPRLKRFKELTIGIPCGIEKNEWYDILDKMIFAFEWRLIYEEESTKLTKTEVKQRWKNFDEGMRLFGKYFCALWW